MLVFSEASFLSARHFTSISTSTMVKQQTMSFLALPPELRVRVYENVILSAPSFPPTSMSFRQYQGFILSNKQIYTEFEAEWLKGFQDTVQAIKHAFRFQPDAEIPTPTRLGESKKILGWIAMM